MMGIGGVGNYKSYAVSQTANHRAARGATTSFNPGSQGTKAVGRSGNPTGQGNAVRRPNSSNGAAMRRLNVTI